jgi:hypothetical protein
MNTLYDTLNRLQRYEKDLKKYLNQPLQGMDVSGVQELQKEYIELLTTLCTITPHTLLSYHAYMKGTEEHHFQIIADNRDRIYTLQETIAELKQVSEMEYTGRFNAEFND